MRRGYTKAFAYTYVCHFHPIDATLGPFRHPVIMLKPLGTSAAYHPGQHLQKVFKLFIQKCFSLKLDIYFRKWASVSPSYFIPGKIRDWASGSRPSQNIFHYCTKEVADYSQRTNNEKKKQHTQTTSKTTTTTAAAAAHREKRTNINQIKGKWNETMPGAHTGMFPG